MIHTKREVPQSVNPVMQEKAGTRDCQTLQVKFRGKSEAPDGATRGPLSGCNWTARNRTPSPSRRRPRTSSLDRALGQRRFRAPSVQGPGHKGSPQPLWDQAFSNSA